MLVNPLILGSFDNIVKAPTNHNAANVLYERLSSHFASKQPNFVFTIQRLNKNEGGGEKDNQIKHNNFFSYIVKESFGLNKQTIDYTIAKYGGSANYEKLSTNLNKISNKMKFHTDNGRDTDSLLDSESSNEKNMVGGKKRLFDDDDDDDDDDDNFDDTLDDFDYELRNISKKKRNRIIKQETPFLPYPYILPYPYLRSIEYTDPISAYIYNSIYDDLTRFFIPTFTIVKREIIETNNSDTLLSTSSRSSQQNIRPADTHHASASAPVRTSVPIRTSVPVSAPKPVTVVFS